jgi:hypothetical protein
MRRARAGLLPREQHAHALRHRPLPLPRAGAAAGPIPLQHDAREVAEPVRREAVFGQRLEHRVRVAELDLAVQLRAQVREQRARRRGAEPREGEQRRRCEAVAQRDAPGEDGAREG